MSDRWKVIPIGMALNPTITQWCVFHPPGPPNTMHSLTTSNRELAEDVAGLLNWMHYQESLPLDRSKREP